MPIEPPTDFIQPEKQLENEIYANLRSAPTAEKLLRAVARAIERDVYERESDARRGIHSSIHTYGWQSLIDAINALASLSDDIPQPPARTKVSLPRFLKG